MDNTKKTVSVERMEYDGLSRVVSRTVTTTEEYKEEPSNDNKEKSQDTKATT